MDIYPPTPEPAFDPAKELKARVKLSSDSAETMIRQWMRSFEAFWMPPRVYADRAFTREQVQAMIDIDHAVVKDMFADSSAFQALIQSQHPEVVGDEDDKIVPLRYFVTPYDIDPVTLQITSDIKPEWDEQPEPVEAEGDIVQPMEGLAG